MAYVRRAKEIQSLGPQDQQVEENDAQPVEAPFPGARKPSKGSHTSASGANTERTPLLKPYTQSNQSRPRSTRSSISAGETDEPTPGIWVVRLSFFLGALLAYASLGFAVLVGLSVVHSSVAAVLPAHRSSTFVPLWFSGLSFCTALLHLMYFAQPHRSPVNTARGLNAASAIVCLISLFVVVFTRDLRYQEAILTIITICIAIVTHIAAAARPYVEPPRAPLPMILHAEDVPDDDESQPHTRAGRVGHFFKRLLSLITVTFPLFLLHLAILAAFVAITANLCLRSYDSKLEAPGNLWWVNPAVARHEGLVDRAGLVGRGAYRLHLHCEGGSDFDGRVVLYEGPASIPGSVGAGWIDSVAEKDKHANGTLRVCRYDRPCYGFSDCAPTSAFGHVAGALEEALEKAGEFARVSKPGGGFVIVAEGYGGLLGRVFAARNPKHISSMLFLDPQTESSYFSPITANIKRDFKFFFRDVLGSFITPLGIRRWFNLFFHGKSSSESRVLGSAQSGLSPTFSRSALQQAYEAHRYTSASYHALDHSAATFPARKPSILISSSKRMEHPSWAAGQSHLANEVLQGLVRWEQVKAGHDVCGSTEGKSVCEAALKRLLR